VNATLTVSQPESPPATPAHDLLLALLERVRDYCKQRQYPVPHEIIDMLPVVRDALASGDEAWTTTAHEYFSIVVQGSLLGEHVWKEAGREEISAR
jgi:hypothetical protein